MSISTTAEKGRTARAAPTAKKVLTLCLLTAGGRVLLGMKKRGFGAGLWNGFGGKVEAGETIAEAAARELREEAGLEAHGLDERGLLTFVFEDDPTALEVHVFAAASWTGVPAETEEMRPRWFDAAEIPFDEMWADDRHWFPLFLAGRRFRGEFLFRDGITLVAHALETLPERKTAL